MTDLSTIATLTVQAGFLQAPGIPGVLKNSWTSLLDIPRILTTFLENSWNFTSPPESHQKLTILLGNTCICKNSGNVAITQGSANFIELLFHLILYFYPQHVIFACFVYHGFHAHYRLFPFLDRHNYGCYSGPYQLFYVDPKVEENVQNWKKLG